MVKKTKETSIEKEAHDLQKKVVELEKKNEALADSLKRVVADFDNYRKRADKEKANASSITQSGIIMEIFPILDNFRRASEHAPQINVEEIDTSAITEDEWRRIHAYFEGVRHIERQLEQALSSAGLQKVETISKQFDPNTMEAVSYESHPELSEGTVIDELEGGYTFNGKIIRPARVRVSKGTAS